jgi:glucose/mannose transport system substrate-binding protein
MARNTRITRRRVLKGAGTVGIAGLAGCIGGNGGNGNSNNGGGKSGSGTLEIQHWWTGGDGSAAIQALLKGFKQKYPDVTVKENPVAGGAGKNLKAVIKKRILNNNPPSTWQAWPGAHLKPFIKANKLKDIGDSVWSKNDMKSAYLKGPKQVAKPAGNYVTVPINIHRLNNLFYNKNVVKKAGVDPASITTPSDLVGALKKVEDAGYIGLAQSTKSAWTTGQLWAQVLLGEAGTNTYTAFTDGKVKKNKKSVTEALEIIKQYSKYFPKDAGVIGWQEANSKVINGEAAFIHQGDWAAGMYRAQNDFTFGKDWDHIPYPGTSGMYSLNMDSFPFPKNNPSPDVTEKFLRYCGSIEAQKRFNPKKGSIPPRTDVPMEPFGPFLKQQRKDFEQSKTQPPSIQHGLAITPDQLKNFNGAIKAFTAGYDVGAAYKDLVTVFQ